MKLNEYKEKLEETNYDVFVTDNTSDLINYLKSKNEMVRIFIDESVPVYLAGMGYETIHLDMIDTANRKGGFELKYNYKDPKQICLIYVPFTDETFDEEGYAYDDNYTTCYGYDKFDIYSEKDFSKFKLYNDLGKCNITDLDDIYLDDSYEESLHEDASILKNKILDKLQSMGYDCFYRDEGWYYEDGTKVEDDYWEDDSEPMDDMWYVENSYYHCDNESNKTSFSWRIDESKKEFTIVGIYGNYEGTVKGFATKTLDEVLSLIPTSWTINIENNINSSYWNHIRDKYPQYNWEEIWESLNEDTNINDIYYRLEIHQKGGLFTSCQDIINKCRGSYSDDEYELGNRLDGLVGQLEYEFKWAPKDLDSKNKYAYTEQEFNRINNLKSYYDEDISVIEDLEQTLSRLGYKLDIIKVKPNKINYKDNQQIAYEKLNESLNSSMTIRLLTRQSQQVKDILKSGTVYRASYSLSNQQLTKQYKALADYFGFKSCPIFCIPENYSNVFIKDGVVGAFGLTDNQINSKPIILDVPVNEVRMMEFYDWCAFMHYTNDIKYDDVFEYTREEALNHIDDYLGNISTQIIDGKVYGYKYPQVIIDKIRPEWVVKESLDESLLLEKTRNQLLTKSKTADNYSKNNQSKGKNRYERRKYSRIARSVAQYNEISMDDLFKKDNLQVGIQVQGETDNYIVQLRFEGVIRELAEEVKRNNGKLEFKNIVKAMSKVFNNGDVFINCSCPDYKYRQSYWATKQGYSIVPELRPSDITNPKDSKGGGCKHILLVLANLDWVMKISSVINNYIKYCQKNLQNAYATYIFPKVYGMPYQKAVQLSLFDDGLLPDDQETLKQVASQNIKNKNKSNLKKPEPVKKGFNKKEEPIEEPVQKTKSKTTGKSPLSTTDKYRYERDKDKEHKFIKQQSLFDTEKEEQ